MSMTNDNVYLLIHISPIPVFHLKNKCIIYSFIIYSFISCFAHYYFGPLTRQHDGLAVL